MGWTTTADVYSNLADWNTGMTFDTVEEAQAFCAKNGWEVTKVCNRSMMHAHKLLGMASGTWNILRP